MNRLKEYAEKTKQTQAKVIETAVKHYIDARSSFFLDLTDIEILNIINEYYGFDTYVKGKDGMKPIYRHLNRFILLRYKYIKDYAKVGNALMCDRTNIYNSEKVINNMLDTEPFFRKQFYELLEKLKEADKCKKKNI